MRYSGLDELLQRRRSELFVYAGYSAGACILAPTLKGIHLLDAPDVVPNGYASEMVWDGLSLLDYSIAPHFRCDHPEASRVAAVIDYFIEHSMSYRALSDGEVVVTESGPVRP